MSIDKNPIVTINEASAIKEMNRISVFIFRLFDKLVEDYKIKINKNEEFEEDDRINGNKQFKKILNLSVQIYNIYITNQNENKDKLKPIDKNQIIELETNFQEEYIINYRLYYNCTKCQIIQEQFEQIKIKIIYTIFLTVFLSNLLNLFEKFKDKEDSNVKDSENKVFMREFLKKLKERYNLIYNNSW